VCSQANATEYHQSVGQGASGLAALTPLGESGGAIDLEDVLAVEVTLLVELVWTEVNGCEGLQTA